MRASIVSIIFLSIFLGFAPVVFYGWFFFLRRSKKFQRGRQPTALLSLMFLGGVASVVVAFFIERELIQFLPPEFGNCVSASPFCQTESGYTILILALATFLLVGPVEEGVKFLAVYFISYRSTQFTRIIDGVKYGVAAALGFASAENALYLFSSLRVLDLNTFVSTFLLRFAISTLAHVLYSGIFGYYLGKAQFQRYGRWRIISTGLFFAVITHGLFDFVLFSQVGFYSILLLAIMFGVIYSSFRSPENFAVRIPEFMRTRPAARRKIYSIPVSTDLQQTYAGLGPVLAEIPAELRPITPAQIKPEFLPQEVPSEFAPEKLSEVVKKELSLPEATVPVRRVGERKRIRSRIAPIVPTNLTQRGATQIVNAAVQDVKKKRLELYKPA